MDQRVRTETGPPPGVPERRGRRGTAAVAPDRIPFQQPELPPSLAIMAHFQRSVEAAYFDNGGPCARELTTQIEQRLLQRAHCVLVSSATTGLMAALRAICGTPRARRRLIACPSYTFTATAGAIVWAGFEPLFVDIEPDGYGLDPESLDAALKVRRGKVAGILACAPFGTAPDAKLRAQWRDIAARHKAPLLIDSAPGFGALDEDGMPLGAQGDTEVFSFHATKTFAVGEGGAVTSPTRRSRRASGGSSTSASSPPPAPARSPASTASSPSCTRRPASPCSTSSTRSSPAAARSLRA